MYSWASGVIWRKFCWILEALEFQVIGCDGIGQRNPGKYRNPGERNRTKIRLGEICQISQRHLHPESKKEWRGDFSRNIGFLINHGWQAKKVARMFFETVGEANGPQRVWQIESWLADMGALDGSTVDTRRNLLPVRLAVCSPSTVQCLLLWSVTSPLSPRALLRCLKHSRILSRGIAGSIFMPFRLIRPTILTAISSPSHAPPHLHQLPTHTTTEPCLESLVFQFIPHP